MRKALQNAIRTRTEQLMKRVEEIDQERAAIQDELYELRTELCTHTLDVEGYDPAKTQTEGWSWDEREMETATCNICGVRFTPSDELRKRCGYVGKQE